MNKKLVFTKKNRLQRLVASGLFIFGVFASFIVSAEEKTVDPSDLTQTVTQFFSQLDSDSNLKLGGSLSGQFNEEHQYMGSLELNLGKNSGANTNNEFGASYLGSRVQLFGALTTDYSFAPKVGYSMDVMHFDGGSNLSAYGGLFLLNPKMTGGFMIFPNIAYATGTIKDSGNAARSEVFYSVQEFALPNQTSIDVDGLMVNVFFSKKINDQGSFIMAWPEYLDVSGGGLDIKQLTWKASLGMPLSDSKLWWLNVVYELKLPNIKLNGVTLSDDKKSKIYVGFKRYF